MTDRGDTVPAHGGEPPVDLAAVRADDALLDALGRGESAAQNNHNRTAAQNNHNPAAHNNHDPAAAQNNHDPAAHDDHDPAAPGDELAALLAGWHADLSTDLPDFPELTTVLAELADAPTAALDLPVESLRPATPLADGPVSGSVGDISDIRSMSGRAVGADISEMSETPEGPRRTTRGDRNNGGRGSGRPGRGLRRTFAAVAAAIVILGGLALGAEHSGPNGPLWPLTQVLYPEQAHARAAEQAIAEAVGALDARRYDEARHHLDIAADEAGQVDNDGTRQRLLDRIADLRAQLPPPETPTPAPSAPGATPTPQAAPTTAAAPTTPGVTATPGGDPTTPGGNGQVIPGLPTQIIPTGPILPLPTQIIPSVPGLPLPTLLGNG